MLSTVASAADLEVVPEPVIPGWAGWYAGVNVGYGVSHDPDVGVAGTEFFLSDVTDLDGFPDEFDPTYELLSRRLNVDASGVFGGGQVGYNWQDGEYVYGVEADIQFSDIKGKDSAGVSDSYDFGIGFVSCPNPRGGLGACVSGQDFGAVAAEQKLKWYSTVRGRIGVAPFEGLLFYATGGVAFGKIKNRAYLATGSDLSVVGCLGGCFDVYEGSILGEASASSSKTKVGYTLGFGNELKITEDVSVKFEYLFMDFGTKTLSSGLDVCGDATIFGEGPFTNCASVSDRKAKYKFKNQFHTIKVGLNVGF